MTTTEMIMYILLGWIMGIPLVIEESKRIHKLLKDRKKQKESKKESMIHYGFPKGATLLIILKDGKLIKDKYVDTKSGTLILKKHKFKYNDIRSTTIWKGE